MVLNKFRYTAVLGSTTCKRSIIPLKFYWFSMNTKIYSNAIIDYLNLGQSTPMLGFLNLGYKFEHLYSFYLFLTLSN